MNKEKNSYDTNQEPVTLPCGEEADKTENQLLLDSVRSGNTEALGELLEKYRPYMIFIAGLQIDPRIYGKLDAGDIVQETCLEAYRAFPSFRGESEGQFSAWLRKILATSLAASVRRFLGTQRRDVRLERSIHASVDQSSVFWDHLVCSTSSPSCKMQRRETVTQLGYAMSQLPEHYREVLRLRHTENLSFSEIAEKMERTVDSVQKIWIRALSQLRSKMKEP